jgi:hypothetical protein
MIAVSLTLNPQLLLASSPCVALSFVFGNAITIITAIPVDMA